MGTTKNKPANKLSVKRSKNTRSSITRTFSIKNKRLRYSALYPVMDGYYRSYWVGKLLNDFMREGCKITSERAVAKASILIKASTGISFYDLLLEKMEKVRPLFKTKFVKVAGKRRDFPAFLSPRKQRSRAIMNLKNITRDRSERSLSHKLLAETIDLNNIRNHQLFKQRDEVFSNAVKNRFNLRYSF